MPSLRLPKTLAFTVMHAAAVATLGCSSQSAGSNDGGPSDAAVDYAPHDSSTACEAGPISFCGNPPCPVQGAYYCTDQCPPDCDPFA
jgi:hypothetical protein